MRSKIGRSIWGVQKASFQEAVQYMNSRHKQAVKKLVELTEAFEAENETIRTHLEFYRARLEGQDPTLDRPVPVQPFSSAVSLRAAVHANPRFQYKFRFKYRLFGLHRRKVNAFIRELKGMQEEELQMIAGRAGRCADERETLLLELSLAVGRRPDEWEAGEIPSMTQAAVDEAQAAVEEAQAAVEAAAALEELREQWEQHEKPRIYKEVMERVKKEALSGAEEPWIVELRESVRRTILQEQKFWDEASEAKEPQSNVIPILQKLTMKKAATRPQQRLTVGGTDFWGEDIEALLVQANPPQLPDQAVAPWIAPASVSVPVHPSEKQEKTVVHPWVKTMETKASPAVEDQAYQLRRKYIVGKISGADLFDDRGGLIVAKNAEITEEAMIRAEREGKLAELIIHMILPRSGE